MNFYEILGVATNATQAEIKAAYKSLAQQNHPDKHPPEFRAQFEAKMAQINEAYATLRDPKLRQQYHRHGFDKKQSASSAWDEFVKRTKSQAKPRPKSKAKQAHSKPEEPKQEPKAEKKAGSGRVGTGYCPRCGGHGIIPIASGYQTIRIACTAC